ncbi:hypothetical protein Taro_056863 [Colocasia esculenta]|uniref:Protein LURP-one-related 8 n=1 Tax=Colocasia esculenta TaxID=4460 RepID=A0A843XXE0_COLES|nr:hypothetical protein [Colocasia esculenta]
MARVHPNTAVASRRGRLPSPAHLPPDAGGEAAVLTVWRKSLLFNCDGFTVFDAKGNLVFRVDNYTSSHRGEVVLMDASGTPLLTIRRKKMSLGENWLVYHGEKATDPLLSVKKHVNFLQSKALAHVTRCSADAERCTYQVEGSYSQRCCGVYDERRQRLAEIRRKEAVGGVGFGGDVFRLVVQPGMEVAVAMAIVILLEEMFGSRGSSLIRG